MCKTPDIVVPGPPPVYSDPTLAHYKTNTDLASPLNEVWFDLVPTGSDSATDETWVSFRPPLDPGSIMSVVLHRDPTSTDPLTAGKAGPKEACLPVEIED